MPTKTIIRADHSKDNPYFMMIRATAQDNNLTFEARGMLAYILSKPDNWQIVPSDLYQKCGKARVYKVLTELMETHYMKRVYHRDERGKITAVEYITYETPFTDEPVLDEPFTDLQEMANQEMANQEMANPLMANPPLHNKDKEHKKEKTIARARNIVFDIVAYVIYDYRTPDAVQKSATPRIGKTTAAYKRTYIEFDPAATDEQIVIAIKAFKRSAGDTSLPRGDDKIATNFGSFLQNYRKVIQLPTQQTDGEFVSPGLEPLITLPEASDGSA